MRIIISVFCLVVLCLFSFNYSFAGEHVDTQNDTLKNEIVQHDKQIEHQNDASHELHEKSVEHHTKTPEGWAVIPFVLLLLMIATGPLFYPHFWHRFYPLIAVVLGIIVVAYYIFALGDTHFPVHSLAEYVSFIALLTALFVASGGILIKVEKEGTPFVNVILLIIGSIIANVIGTTGASMLLIRPFIRLNKQRIKPYHIVFFIFMVSNVGGALTPIGDPPLFLGFLKGIPFFWTLTNVYMPWAFGVGLLALIFYFLDKRNHAGDTFKGAKEAYSGKIEIKGIKNVLWLAITIAAVFIDPNVMSWVPAITYEGMRFSFLRELIMFAAAFFAFRLSDKTCLKGNEFDFEPIKEVAYLFVGIFATMMPALQLISGFANSSEGQELISVSSLYWATGTLSGILDNAPTYLNFLAAGMGKVGLDINNKVQILEFVQQHAKDLMAISVGAVFFGAFTYIGNAPNFMVKSIAEQIGIQMPSFMGYVVKYSIPFLLPVLFLTWLIFFFLF